MFKMIKKYFEENLEAIASGMAAVTGVDIYTYID